MYASFPARMSVDLFLGIVQDHNVLSGSQVELSANGQPSKAKGRINDAVAHRIGTITQPKVLQAGILGADAHNLEGIQAGVLSSGSGGANSNTLAQQIMDILQTGLLQRYATGNRGVNRTR